jgi:signal transduction histidine kinase
LATVDPEHLPRADALNANETPLDAERLLEVARQLALARELSEVTAIARRAARSLTGADGVTFVIREGDVVWYADEDAIEPLWKGRRFPVDACISGWAMEHRETVVIEDIYVDDRIPLDAYRPTFVKSLAMVPVRPEDPVAAIGAYWARRHRATARELRILETVAGLAAVAYANQALYADLRRAIAVRDEFLSVASHELRSPLAGLRLQIGMVLRRMDNGRVPARDAISRMDRTAARITGMVEKLLDVSRLIEHRMALHRSEFELGEVVRGAIAALPEQDAALIQLAAAPVRGRWDRTRIQQIVDNLLENAVKFGGEKPIHVSVEERSGEAILKVQDSGIGIAPEDRSRLFERFERAVSVRHYGGFGVGLWLVRRNAEAHGGRVQVESAPGAGSTFTVALPLR